MKAIIFAGGAGTRLWPLSRKKSPKQLEKIIDDKSTLQYTVNRLKKDFNEKDIFIATNEIYRKIIQKQLPEIPLNNFFFEPEKKDVGPAIALVMGILNKTKPDEPTVILWSDHFIRKSQYFNKLIKIAGKYISENKNKIVFIAHKPRFPSINLGYIRFSRKKFKIDGINFYQFEGFKYRPSEDMAKQFVSSKQYAWNLGYFVTTPRFICNAFNRFAPNIYNNTELILSHFGKKSYKKALSENYGKVESINFDNAILENLNKEDALLMIEDLGWSDIGAWESLKEALEVNPLENVIRGNIHLENVKDSLIYNFEDNKLIVGIDLDKHIIVNTKDVILITKEESVSKIKKLVESFKGTRHEKLT